MVELRYAAEGEASKSVGSAATLTDATTHKPGSRQRSPHRRSPGNSWHTPILL